MIRRQIVTNNFESVSGVFYDLTCPIGLTPLSCSCLNGNTHCSFITWEKHETRCVFWAGYLDLPGQYFQANALCGIGIVISPSYYSQTLRIDTSLRYVSHYSGYNILQRTQGASSWGQQRFLIIGKGVGVLHSLLRATRGMPHSDQRRRS